MNNYKIYGLSEPGGETIRYIGFTGQELADRYSGHFSKLETPTHKTCWIKGLRNKGLRPGVILIEDGLTKEEASQKEIHYIKMFKSFGARLVNMTAGGEKGVSEINRGRIVSNETREKLRIKSTGRKHSDETKRKVGLKSKNRIPGIDVRRKMSIAHSVSVRQFDLSNNLIEKYYGIREAEKHTGISHGSISAVCKNKRKTAGGFIWKYKNLIQK